MEALPPGIFSAGICTEPGMSAETQRVGTVLALEEVTIQSGWRVDS